MKTKRHLIKVLELLQGHVMNEYSFFAENESKAKRHASLYRRHNDSALYLEINGITHLKKNWYQNWQISKQKYSSLSGTT